MTWFRSIVASRTTDWHTAPLRHGDLIPPNEAYLNIHLRSLRIRDVRKGLRRFSAAVHSFVEFQHRGEGTAAVHTFTVPDGLRAIDPKNLNRVIVSSQRLLGPVPYRGGDVSIDIALFSIETENLLDGVVDLVGDLAAAAGVGYVNAALPFVGPIDKAVHLLVDASGPNVLEVGLSKDLEAPRAGLFIVARAPSAGLGEEALVYDDNHRVTRADGGPFDYPYLTFEILATRRREAWFAIPALRAAHAGLNNVAGTGSVPAAKEMFGAFRLAVLGSPDLLSKDAGSIVRAVEADLELQLGATTVGVGKAIALTPLEQLDPFP